MELSEEHSKLRSTLIQFLKDDPKLVYPKIEALIVSLEPLQVSDDYENFVDFSDLQADILERYEFDEAGTYSIVLEDWNYIFKRVPNSQEYYFDVEAHSYKVLELDEELQFYPRMSLADDPQVKKWLERKKKKNVKNRLKAAKPTIKAAQGHNKETPNFFNAENTHEAAQNYQTHYNEDQPDEDLDTMPQMEILDLEQLGDTDFSEKTPQSSNMQMFGVMDVDSLLDLTSEVKKGRVRTPLIKQNGRKRGKIRRRKDQTNTADFGKNRGSRDSLPSNGSSLLKHSALMMQSASLSSRNTKKMNLEELGFISAKPEHRNGLLGIEDQIRQIDGAEEFLGKRGSLGGLSEEVEGLGSGKGVGVARRGEMSRMSYLRGINDPLVILDAENLLPSTSLPSQNDQFSLSDRGGEFGANSEKVVRRARNGQLGGLDGRYTSVKRLRV